MSQTHHIDSLREAIRMFDEFADMPNMAFGFIKSGCAEAAHVMGHIMMQKQLHVGKVWAIEAKKGISVLRPDRTDSIWWYHVAPTVGVRMPSGKIDQLIFDPALFDGPVYLHEWRKVMHSPKPQIECLKWRQKPTGYNGNFTPNTRIDASTIFNARAQLREFEEDKDNKKLRSVFQSSARKLYLVQSKKAGNDNSELPPKSGQTWRAGKFNKQDYTNFIREIEIRHKIR